jgi:hypothetical protein
MKDSLCVQEFAPGPIAVMLIIVLEDTAFQALEQKRCIQID